MPLPAVDLDIQVGKKGEYIVWDILRRKYVKLTPEEWVRQHLVHFLVFDKNYPTALLSIEKSIEVYGRTRRFDLLGFDRNAQPLLIAEVKAQNVSITDETLMQLAAYNTPLDAPYWVLTNGEKILTFQKTSESKMRPLTEIPLFEAMLASVKL